MTDKAIHHLSSAARQRQDWKSRTAGITRRAFISSTTVGTIALLSPFSRVLGANDDIRLGFIGLGGRGGQLISQFTELPGVRIAGLCDADGSRLAQFAQRFPKAQAVAEMRTILENKDIDAVVIATSNQWHSLAAIWAIQAGKDVYVEKPCSHNIWEGRRLVEAARKYNRIVQGGTQQRSDPMQVEVKEFLDSGVLGKMKFVRLNRFGVRQSIGRRNTPLPIPDTVNYDLWLGPAEDQPIHRENLQYDWHWDWNMGNGELGNWGPHVLDDCRHIAFRDRVGLPRRVVAGGGRFLWNDAGTTPNTHFIYYDTEEAPVVMAVHNLPLRKDSDEADRYERLNTRAFLIIQCENGYYAGSRGRGAAFDQDGREIKSFRGDSGAGHTPNFLAALRSRKRQDLAADVEQTHYSAAWAHLGNISYQLGRSYDPKKALESVKGYRPWEDLIAGFETHTRANGIDPAQAGARLGPMLELDTKAETLVGPTATAETKALLRRKYRKPYIVPEKV